MSEEMWKPVSDREVDEARDRAMTRAKTQWYEVDEETATKTNNGDVVLGGRANQITRAGGRYFIQVISIG